MKDRLAKRFETSIQVFQNAKQFLANDQTDEFSEAIDAGMEGISRVQDDLAIYGEIVTLRKTNADLVSENTILKTECEKLRAESE